MGNIDPSIKRPADVDPVAWQLARAEAERLASGAGSAAVGSQVEAPAQPAK
ncbi:MAG TPA: hypothetical protein VLH86_00505 [Patescibacteria group bacterium]|nr:hypothetical protein [Patescibacteria group bacterium]